MKKSGSKGESEFGSDEAASASLDHRSLLQKRDYTAKFRAAIDYLAPAPASPATLTALFDDRAAYHIIRNWKYGRSLPPIWAVELLATKLRRSAMPALRTADSIAGICGPGSGGHRGRALAAWRERKARERDAKEKAPD